MAQTCALIAQVQPILHRVPCSVETLPNALKCYETQQNESLGGPLCWIGCVHCEKFQGNFMARTWALIAPVQPILHRVSCSNERLPNASKHYETHQNRSLGSNWCIGCIRCENFQCDFMPRTCALILPLQPTLHQFRAVTKQSKMHPNTSKRTKTWV